MNRFLFSGLLALVTPYGNPIVAQDRWIVHQHIENVELFAEFPVSGRSINKHLSEVAAELKDSLGIEGSGQTVQVIVFNSMQNYRDYLSTRIPEVNSRRAIFYQKGDLFQIYTFRHQELITDLRHEYAHALLHQSLPYVPLWIDEGVAEFVEEQPGHRAQAARLKSMRWKCRTGWRPKLETLEKIPTAASMSSDNYRDSWAWVHYLLCDSVRTRTLFKTYIQAISAGEAPGAFSKWAAERDSHALKHVGSYFRRFRFSLR